VIVPATESNPVGVTPDVVGGVAATVVEVDVVEVVEAVEVVASDVVAGEAVSPDAHPPASTSAATSHARVIADTVGGSVPRVPATCESCGAPDEQLYPVRRRYVTPAEWDTPARDVTLDQVEQWCFSCCTHYPHEPAS
jgi:hypothetical protein